MGKADDARELLSDTMKNLMPPRVEVTRRHHDSLEALSKRTGKPVKELVRQALDWYLAGELRPGRRGAAE